jgi:hypothetical protein
MKTLLSPTCSWKPEIVEWRFNPFEASRGLQAPETAGQQAEEIKTNDLQTANCDFTDCIALDLR